MDQNEEKRVWGIHTQDDILFLQDSVIAIGWREFGDLSVLNATREDFKQHYLDVYPDAKKVLSPTVPVCCIALPMKLRKATMLFFRPEATEW